MAQILSKVKNSQRWYLLQRTSGGFCDVDLHFVVVILHLLMFFIHIFFSTSSLTLPWSIARFSDPFCTFSPPIAEWFATLSFFFHYLLTASATVLSGHFLTHRRFLPYAPSRHFWYSLLLSRLPWEPAVISWKLQGFILILETQTRLICLFDSQ